MVMGGTTFIPSFIKWKSLFYESYNFRTERRTYRKKETAEWIKLHEGKCRNLYVFTKYFQAHPTKRDEMGGTCKKDGGCMKIIQNFGRRLKGLGERGVDRRSILKWTVYK